MSETSLSLLDELRLRPDSASWQRLVDLYTPLIRGWLARHSLDGADADDLTQEVMSTLVRELPNFQHDGHSGAFRGWLRVILLNRVRNFWRSRQHRPQAIGGSDFLRQLEQLEDGASEMSQLWDREHDRHVMGRLLDLVQPRFAGPTWEAFRRQVLEEVPADAVAQQLDMPLTSVYAAKSRVLKALRCLAKGLID